MENLRCFIRLFVAALVVAVGAVRASAVPAGIGVTVNGTDIGATSGGAGATAWTYSDSTNLVLSGAGPYVISGTNGTKNVVSIHASNDCVVVASNLVITARYTGSSARPYAPFDCGTYKVDLRLWSGSGTTNQFIGGPWVPGIAVVSNAAGVASLAITNLNENGALYAYAGVCAAAIGGGNGESCGAVTIAGGDVFANVSDGGAGIGGGDKGNGGTVTITGGRVRAVTTGGAAGIGGGHTSGRGGRVAISGGTVYVSGNSSCTDIGGYNATLSTGTNIFTGGSIFPKHGTAKILPAPVNAAGKEVYCLTLPGLTAGTQVAFTGLDDYGANDILADADGKAYIWLPRENTSFTANGQSFSVALRTITATAGSYGSISPSGDVEVWPDETRTFTITPDLYYRIVDVRTNGVSAGAVTSLTVSGLMTDMTISAEFEFAGVGVAVNGRDLYYSDGAGWAFTNSVLSLTDAGPYVISGANVFGSVTNAVSIHAANDCVVVASNLVVTARITGSSTNSPLNCGTHKVDIRLWSDPGTTNQFIGGFKTPGIAVISNAAGIASLSITNLNESGALYASAGGGSAAIGGGYQESCGTVTISGGIVHANVNNGAAGIGGGDKGNGGTVTITGGRVTAVTTGNAAGIGGGYSSGRGGRVAISGGTVYVSGGTMDIGGYNATLSTGTNIFTGGSIFPAHGTAMILPAPVNGAGTRVYCVTNGGFVAKAPVSLALSCDYGMTDLYADAGGKLYLWLPAGDYVAGGSFQDGASTNAVLQGFGVSTTGTVTGPTNATLTITGYDAETGVITYSPETLPEAALETIYSTDLTDAVWSPDRPTNTPALFMKLRVR